VNEVKWVWIGGGMSGSGGYQNPIWNLAYPDMGMLAIKDNRKEGKCSVMKCHYSIRAQNLTKLNTTI